MTTNNKDNAPDYSRDKAIHIAVIVICSLLVIVTLAHPGLRAMALHGVAVWAHHMHTAWVWLVNLI
jgi:hypothetical protein